MKAQVINNSPHIPDSVAWKSLSAMIDKFGFNQEEARVLMGDMPRSSFSKGINQRQGGLNRDQKERISYLLGIYKALRIIFIDSEQAMSWVDRPNTLAPFNGITPRKYLLEGSIVRLADVRRFLDFWRGY